VRVLVAPYRADYLASELTELLRLFVNSFRLELRPVEEVDAFSANPLAEEVLVELFGDVRGERS